MRSILAQVTLAVALAVYWLLFAPLERLFWLLAGEDS